MLVRCVSTVLGLRNNFSAISWFDNPFTICFNISISLDESKDREEDCFPRERDSSGDGAARAMGISLLKKFSPFITVLIACIRISLLIFFKTYPDAPAFSIFFMMDFS